MHCLHMNRIGEGKRSRRQECGGGEPAVCRQNGRIRPPANHFLGFRTNGNELDGAIDRMTPPRSNLGGLGSRPDSASDACIRPGPVPSNSYSICHPSPLADSRFKRGRGCLAPISSRVVDLFLKRRVPQNMTGTQGIVIVLIMGLIWLIWKCSRFTLSCRGCEYCSWDHQHIPEPRGHVYGHRPKPERPLPRSGWRLRLFNFLFKGRNF